MLAQGGGVGDGLAAALQQPTCGTRHCTYTRLIDSTYTGCLCQDGRGGLRLNAALVLAPDETEVARLTPLGAPRVLHRPVGFAFVLVHQEQSRGH